MNVGHCLRQWSVSRELVILFQVHIEAAHKNGDFPYNGVSHKRATPICFSEPFPCYFSENDQVRTINMSKRRIIGWQIQLPYRRDIFHTGVFERRVLLLLSRISRVRLCARHLQIQQGDPKVLRPVLLCSGTWGHDVWTWGARNGRWGQELEWICKVVMSCQPEKGSSDWSVLMPQIETALERGGAQ